jgi:hypothetical protein
MHRTRLFGATILLGVAASFLASMGGCASVSSQECTGTPQACVEFSSDDCESQLGCWVDEFGYCSGDPAVSDCSGLPDSVCTQYIGCSWK